MLGATVADAIKKLRLGAIAAVALVLAVAALVAPAPQCAWAADGAIGYAYLDPDENGDCTALVVQDVRRTEVEVNVARCVDLGPWTGSGTVPWVDFKDTIRSVSFVSEGEGVRPEGLTRLFSGCVALERADLSQLDGSRVSSLYELFYSCSSLSDVNLSGFDTSSVTSMSAMFYGCSSLASLDLSGFDTSSVSYMDYMFDGCSSMVSLDLTSLDTSSARDVSYMFYGCSSLVSLDLSSFDISSAKNVSAMFSGCRSLTSLDLSGFGASSATNMYAMFYGCSSLTSLDLSSFDTSSATNMGYMFCGCSSLASLDLLSFDTSSATNMYAMFYGCSSLTSLDLSSFDTSSVTDMHAMFNGCSSLTSLGLSSFDTSSVTDMGNMFYGCRLFKMTIGPKFRLNENSWFPVSESDPWFPGGNAEQALASVDEINSFAEALSGSRTIRRDTATSGICGSCLWSVDDEGVLVIAPAEGREGVLDSWSSEAPWSGCAGIIRSVRIEGSVKAKTCYCMFYGCSSLASLDLSGLDTSSVTSMRRMFCGCSSLASLDLSGFDTSSVWSMYLMFSGCSSLTSLDLPGFDTSSVRDMLGMFEFCSSLTFLDLSSFDTSSVRDMSYMFSFCSSLASLDMSGFDTSSVTNMRCMFGGCSSLASLDLSGFDTPSATSMYDMFSGCRSLASLDLSSFDTSSVTSMRHMFCDCSSLASLDLSGFDTSSVTDMYEMLSGTERLESVSLGASCSCQLPEGVWQCEEDGALYLPGEVPSGVEASYRRLAIYAAELTYATLGAGDTLTVDTYAYPDSPEGYERSWPVSDFGYGSADEVPWHGSRADVKSVVVKSTSARSLAHWFEGCADLASADLSGASGMGYSRHWDSSLAGLFDGCSSLAGVSGLDKVDTFNVTDFSDMFRGCSSLGSLDLSGMRTGRAASMRRMFHGCRSLASVALGAGFTFRGLAPSRLPGSELPDGAWAPASDPNTAYASDSLPSFQADTYSLVDQDMLADPDAGIVLVSSRGETAEGKPQLTVSSQVDADGTEELTYEVADDYPSGTLYVGGSPRASALRFSSGTVGWSTVLSRVRSSSANARTTSVVVGSRVRAISPYAFYYAPNVRTVTVKSAKLRTWAAMHSCMAGSNVSRVWVSGMSGAKTSKVVAAFNAWAWQQ